MSREMEGEVEEEVIEGKITYAVAIRATRRVVNCMLRCWVFGFKEGMCWWNE